MKHIIILILLCTSIYCHTQNKKAYQITRTEQPLVIDGILDERIWDTLQVATNFIQFRPDIGHTPEKEKRTDVKMASSS